MLQLENTNNLFSWIKDPNLLAIEQIPIGKDNDPVLFMYSIFYRNCI